MSPTKEWHAAPTNITGVHAVAGVVRQSPKRKIHMCGCHDRESKHKACAPPATDVLSHGDVSARYANAAMHVLPTLA